MNDERLVEINLDDMEKVSPTPFLNLPDLTEEACYIPKVKVHTECFYVNRRVVPKMVVRLATGRYSPFMDIFRNGDWYMISTLV